MCLLQVTVGPAGESGGGSGPGPGQVVVLGGAGDGELGVGDGLGRVTADERERGAVQLECSRYAVPLRSVRHRCSRWRFARLTVGPRCGKALLEVAQAFRDAGELAVGHQCRDETERQHGPGLHHVVGEEREPGHHRRLLPVPLQRTDRELGEVGCPFDVAGGQGMADGGGRFARLVVPLAGAAVQVGHVLAAALEHVGLQHLGEQVVVAVPAAGVVEWDQEQVGAVQVLQHLLALGVPGDGRAQRSAQPVQDAGLEQEVAHRLRLAAQHLLDQVVHDVAVVAGEGRDERRGLGPPPQRECRQLEGGHPALRCVSPARRCRRW